MTQKYQNVPGKRFKWYRITHKPYLFIVRGGGQNIRRQKKGDSYFYEPPDNYMKVTF